jgi:hypothetical protein
MTRRCEGCRRIFTPQRDHHRRCWDCWKAGQGRAVEGQAYSRGYLDGLRDGASRQPPTIDRDLARQALRLTHPDLHVGQRKAKAHRVTAALLGIANGTPRKVETRSLQ